MSLKQRLRSLLIALAVLALSAGVAMAGRGAHLAPTVPSGPTLQGDQADQDGQTGDEDADAPETDAPETEAPETDAPETEAPETDGSGGAPDAAPATHPDNHGALVSAAAQAATPPGNFANHGAYVRSVATANAGHQASGAARTKHQPKQH